MTAEEIIDSKYPFPAGKLKDVTLNGVQVKELMESLVKLSPLPDNNGVKDGFEEWLIKEVDEKETDLAKSIDSGLPTQTDRIQLFALKDCLSAYRNFSPPAKVEVSESDIFEILSSIHPNAMYKDGKLSAWIDDDTKHIAVRKLCHLLSNK